MNMSSRSSSTITQEKSKIVVELENPKSLDVTSYIRGQEVDFGKGFVDFRFKEKTLDMRVTSTIDQFKKFMKIANRELERIKNSENKRAKKR